MKLFKEEQPIFPTTYNEILQRVHSIDPVKYGSTRNYINGAITYLSPYISRGIISTKFILENVLSKGYKANQIEKFIQELAWRDYFQQVWCFKNNSINTDLKHTQKLVSNHSISKVIVEAKTGIIAIDNAINELYKTGYMHNHLRMYIASLSCNIAQSHWKFPAKWMYYNLLDSDWGSNALNWQWVAGTNSNKKYFANQSNINKFCFTKQKETFLNIPYEKFSNLEIPKILKKYDSITLKTPLPKQTHIEIDSVLPSCIYNSYNLDPLWKKNDSVNRILLLEPSHFKQYPVSQKNIDFIIKLSKENLANIQVYVGEFNKLVSEYKLKKIFFKEHPLNNHYKGNEVARNWMFEVRGYFPSFFSFWNKCKKELK